MTFLMNWLIASLASASYVVGAWAIYRRQYTPSIYTRFIWLLLELNALASNLALKTSSGVLALSAVSVAGCAIILTMSLWRSKKEFGPTEIICTILLIISLLLWIFTRLPFLTLSISLIAYFIAGVPTLKRVLVDSKSEYLQFWLFFFLASVLSFAMASKSNPGGYLYPLYFMLFDGSMTALCARKFITRGRP